MVRFIVNLVLIPGVLLTQFAAVPHAHADGTHSTAHEGQPHFHIHLFNPTEHAREPVAARACTASGCFAAMTPDVPDDHDADAVFVESATAAPDREKQPAAEFLAIPHLILPFRTPDGPRTQASRPYTSHARLFSRCPIYVQFQALTI